MGETENDLTLPGLVHDLNNIFQTLVEAAELLSSDARWEPLAAIMLRSVERGKSITRSIESANETRAPFETIVNNAIGFVEDSLIAGGGPRIAFEREIDEGIELRRPWAWERVFINLFSNAARAMPDGGTIRVRAQRSGQEVHIRVEDNGPGIPPEILADIFNPRVSTRGSGLGLHIVRSIVKQDGGDIRACNRTASRGAEFTIIMPAESRSVPAHA